MPLKSFEMLKNFAMRRTISFRIIAIMTLRDQELIVSQKSFSFAHNFTLYLTRSYLFLQSTKYLHISILSQGINIYSPPKI